MKRRLGHGAAEIRHTIFDDWMWIRIVFGLFCVTVAYAIWFLAFGKHTPKREDIAPIVTLAIAVFGVTQGILRWLAVPDPAIERGPLVPVHGGFGILHIRVWNCDVARWLRPLVVRTAPRGCKVHVRYTQNGNVVLGWLLARWNENPEPLTQTQTGIQPDPRLMAENRRLGRLYPTDRTGEFAQPYEVAFAIKEDGQNDFHHFNDESYPHQPGWRNPAWALSQGAYGVEVAITGYGLIRAARASFRLRNDGTSLKDFGWPD